LFVIHYTSAARGAALPEPGSLLRLSGIQMLELEEFFKAPYSFRLLMRSTGDIVVLRRPGWWNARRALVGLGASAGLLLGALLWIKLLRRRVEDGTRELRAEIEERKRIAEALRASSSYTRSLIEVNLDPLATISTEGKITDVNEASVRAIGLAREQLIGTDFSDYFTEPVKAREVYRKVFADGFVRDYPLAISHPSGRVTNVLYNASVYRDTQGRVLGVFAAARDITERRQLEERLRQSQKMEGIGHLAGGMAHEFNNILASMMMNLDMVKTCDPNAEARELLTEMEALSRRAADLIKQLLAFSRQSVMQFQPMDLAVTVSRQSKMLERLLGERTTLELSLPRNLSWVNADQAMIEQVLLNLCLNARDAMKNGGLLRLELTESEVAAKEATGYDDAKPGKYVCLSVTDTGPGMDEHTLERLFEPFFTTKEVGQGTGLGLATVRGIVQQHQGLVEVESAVGKGSTFRVYLPAVAPPLLAAKTVPVETRLRGKGTILLVEDEPSVRKATRKLLVRTGYVVMEAADGKEALALWEAHRAEVDLVYTDMVMPGDLSGLQLADRILDAEPDKKVIITSGYTTQVMDLEKGAKSPIVYLPKPCPPATLISVIQRLMN